jgi:hypothetical protein
MLSLPTHLLVLYHEHPMAIQGLPFPGSVPDAVCHGIKYRRLRAIHVFQSPSTSTSTLTLISHPEGDFSAYKTNPNYNDAVGSGQWAVQWNKSHLKESKARQGKARQGGTSTDTYRHKRIKRNNSYNCQQVYLCDSRSSWPDFKLCPLLASMRLVPGFDPLVFSASQLRPYSTPYHQSPL